MPGVLNAFTVDVEDYFQVAALSRAVARDRWEAHESRVERNTDRILQLLADRGVRGTFFVLGWVADRHPGLVRRITAAGHEIGSHGWSHQFIYAQTREDFTSETSRSRKLLQDLSGQPVRGYRAASFSITSRSLWALDVLIDLGFEYDSSIFPIRHDFYGVPGAERDPAIIAGPSGRQIVEFPMSVATFAGMRLPVSGGGYFRLLPYWLFRAGMRRVNEADGLPVPFYMHPWEIDAEQPRFRVSALSRFRHYTNLERCEARLRRLLDDFEFATMEDVLMARGLLGRAAVRRPAIAVGERALSGMVGAAG